MHNTSRKIINPKGLFYAEGFTHAVSTQGKEIIYVSGQLPWDEDFQVVGEGNLEKQAEQVFKNIGLVLNETGASWENVVKLTTYTTKPEENETIATVRSKVLDGTPTPADTLIGVTALADPRCLIEIEAIVVL